jgi:hypothetical protein
LQSLKEAEVINQLQKISISFEQLSLDENSVEVEWNIFKNALLQGAGDVCGKR